MISYGFRSQLQTISPSQLQFLQSHEIESLHPFLDRVPITIFLICVGMTPGRQNI